MRTWKWKNSLNPRRRESWSVEVAKGKHQILLFMVELTRPWKMKCSLPIEINIPKRFSCEGNSNILHREKMLSFYVWAVGKGWREKEERNFLICLVKRMAEKSGGKAPVVAELLTSNNWKHFTLIWIILTIPPRIRVSYFQLWVYYCRKSRRSLDGDGKRSQLSTKLFLRI